VADIFIAVLVYTIQSAVAILAVYVTIYPLADHQIKHKRAALWIIGFLWIAGLTVTGIQQHRSNSSQTALQGRLDAIDKNTKEPPKVQVTNNISPNPVVVLPEGRKHQAANIIAEGSYSNFYPDIVEVGQPLRFMANWKHLGDLPAVHPVPDGKIYLLDSAAREPGESGDMLRKDMITDFQEDFDRHYPVYKKMESASVYPAQPLQTYLFGQVVTQQNWNDLFMLNQAGLETKTIFGVAAVRYTSGTALWEARTCKYLSRTHAISAFEIQTTWTQCPEFVTPVQIRKVL